MTDDLRGDSKHIDPFAELDSPRVTHILKNMYEEEVANLECLVAGIEDYASKHNQKNHVSREVLRMIKEYYE